MGDYWGLCNRGPGPEKRLFMPIFQASNACDSKRWSYFRLMEIIDIAEPLAITFFSIKRCKGDKK
jgi:hypothetical protein